MRSSNPSSDFLIRTLRGILMAPFWFLQLLGPAKSFEKNPIIGSRLLNLLGLHALRVVLAHGITRLRWLMLATLLPRWQRRQFRGQGFLLVRDFLSVERFAALDAEVRGYRGEVRECIQGDTQTHRTLLDDAALRELPACAALTRDQNYRRLLQWVAVRYGQPLIFIEQVRNGFVGGGGDDPQKNLHADTFHPTMKAWLYLDDVPESSGPFAYVPGSNQLTWKRLAWEYRQSLLGRDLPDNYARRGSLRIEEDNLAALDLPQPQRFAVPANTLLIADTFGFHARSPAQAGSTRLAIYADSRTNPFNPWPGLGLHWTSQLRYRALQWYRRREDALAARRGEHSSWHRVDRGAAGSEPRAS